MADSGDLRGLEELVVVNGSLEVPITPRADETFSEECEFTFPDALTMRILERESMSYVRKDHAPGDTSDGFHTFDELYEHRTVLFACLCNTYQDVNGQEGVTFRSRKHHDGTMYDGFFIAGILTDGGWVTYHCEDRFWHYFGRVPEMDFAPKWDGATPDHGLGRLYDMFIERWRGR